MKDVICAKNTFRFVFPVDGDVLNDIDGIKKDNLLYVKVKLASGIQCEINGVTTEKEGGFYTAVVPFRVGENKLIAQYENEKIEATVFRFENATNICRLSSDDNIIFLWDLNKNKDKYTSLFDNPYLAIYKKAHDLYGITVHLNIYYEMPPHPDFKEEREYFNLSMMTEKYKDEWKANSGWLKLNFHAKADKPDMPYANADYDTVYKDASAIQKEIIRFAGKDTLSTETTVHWGKIPQSAIKAVQDCGINNLAGYFILEGGKPVVAYSFPKDLTAHFANRDFWIDTDNKMIYSRIDCVLNQYAPNEIISVLDTLYDKKTQAGLIEIMIHEEYFYPDYAAYLPDFEDRVLTACKWLYENGYKGVFLSDIK